METTGPKNAEKNAAQQQENQSLLERINASYDDAAYAEDQAIMQASRGAYRKIVERERLLEEEYEREQSGSGPA